MMPWYADTADIGTDSCFGMTDRYIRIYSCRAVGTDWNDRVAAADTDWNSKDIGVVYMSRYCMSDYLSN
jgi:hypothetical protein